jgi:hypothetical protein
MKTFNLNRSKSLSFVFLFLFIFTTHSMSARPFIGSDSQIATENCGECTCTYVYTTTYIFWINTGTSRELSKVEC